MKKVLVLISLVASVALIGCGDGSGATTEAGGKNSLNPEAPKAKAGGKSNGIADASATPAPAGVKTGTPGGG